MDALAGDDDRTLRGDQRLGDLRHRLRIGAAAEARRLRVFGDQRVGDLLAQDVGREFDQHRAGPAVLDDRKGAAQRLDRRVGHRDLLGRLRDVAEVHRRVEVRMHLVDVAGVARRQHDDRAGIAVGLGDAAERVLGAGPVLHDEDADLVARGHLGDRVAHMQPDALLTHHDRADIGFGRALDDRVDRIADQPLDPFLLQDLGDRIGDFHWRLLRSNGNDWGHLTASPAPRTVRVARRSRSSMAPDAPRSSLRPCIL